LKKSKRRKRTRGEQGGRKGINGLIKKKLNLLFEKPPTTRAQHKGVEYRR